MSETARDYLEPVRVWTPAHLLVETVTVLEQGMPAFYFRDRWHAVLPRHAVGVDVTQRLGELAAVSVDPVSSTATVAQLRGADAVGGFVLVVDTDAATGQVRLSRLPPGPSAAGLRALAHDQANALQLLGGLASEETADPALVAAFDHLGRLIKRLGELIRADEPRGEVLDVVAICAKTTDWLRPSIFPVNLDFDADSEQLMARGERAAIERILVNLVLNATEAIEGRRSIRVAVHRDQQTVIVDVDDDGPGVAKELRHTLFDPGATTGRPGRGMGLAAARALALRMGGQLRLLRTSTSGSTFRLELPAARRI